MKNQRQIFFKSCVVAFMLFLFFPEIAIPQLKGTVFRRVSRASNFEFSIFNAGFIWDQFAYDAIVAAFWPRGSFHMYPSRLGAGPLFLAKKGGKYLETDAQFSRNDHPFNQTVPGRVGDRKAGYDPVYNGSGWLYVDDPDYIVYSSLDYDSTGVDISGNNYNDWPIRSVNGAKKYVVEPLQRRNYPPVYLSDEDLFCVFKDTDTRADYFYIGPNGPSVPIGLEFQLCVYSWGSGPGKDIVLFQYSIMNKSGTALDSCYFAFGPGLGLARFKVSGSAGVPRRMETYFQQPWRNLAYVKPINPETWHSNWSATPVPPTVGYPFLETPRGYDGAWLGLTYAALEDEVNWFEDIDSVRKSIYNKASDSVMYSVITHPNFYDVDFPNTSRNDPYLSGPVLITGPFPMQPNDTATTTIAFIFSDSLPHLLLLDDFITKVYNSGFQRPSPPPPPKLKATGLDRSVKLSWDNAAESATDPIIPDSLGKPFKGYRLLRAKAKEGPYVEIGKWTTDTTLVHEYLDRGTEIGGLKNNVRYYYRILSFDEGAKLLKLDPMESKPIDGVNAQSVVPTTEPTNAISSESGGSLLSGVLGDVSLPRLLPLNPTNFNNLLSGRRVQITVGATTDGIRYMIPVTIKDTIAGRTTNAVIDPNLLVHGSPSIAGIKEGKGVIHDIFTIGAADVEIPYKFEQLSEPYHIVPTLEAPSGADVPTIIDDSLKVTGINLYTPYSSVSREILVEFAQGGIDTVSVLFQRYFPYLNVTVTEEGLPITDYQIKATGVRLSSTQIYTGKPNRYYLTGTLTNNEQWEFGCLLSMYESKIAFDFPDRGIGSGKTGILFSWASKHKAGTKDFQVGDKVRIKWQGGVKAVFPQGAVIALEGAPPSRAEVTGEMMEKIRIVPNPYMVTHEAQRSSPRLYFNYLPEECTIRIYTIALDLVKTLTHNGGSREEWDLTTEGGQLVASQLLFAYIESTNGKKTVKKFSVVVGK